MHCEKRTFSINLLEPTSRLSLTCDSQTQKAAASSRSGHKAYSLSICVHDQMLAYYRPAWCASLQSCRPNSSLSSVGISDLDSQSTESLGQENVQTQFGVSSPIWSVTMTAGILSWTRTSLSNLYNMQMPRTTQTRTGNQNQSMLDLVSAIVGPINDGSLTSISR